MRTNARAAERAVHTVEVAKLTARVRELDDTNNVLGKAIGLLHAMSEEEPANTRHVPIFRIPHHRERADHRSGTRDGLATAC